MKSGITEKNNIKQLNFFAFGLIMFASRTIGETNVLFRDVIFLNSTSSIFYPPNLFGTIF